MTKQHLEDYIKTLLLSSLAVDGNDLQGVLEKKKKKALEMPNTVQYNTFIVM